MALSAGCQAKKRAAAGEHYQRELRAHQARFAEFQERYPALERQIAEARDKAPGNVVRVVRSELLPLLDGLSRGYRDMVRSGRAYVALLPSSMEAREALRRQLDAFEEQQRFMDQIRDSYREEATLYARDPVDRAALEEVFSRRAAAALRMQQIGKE